MGTQSSDTVKDSIGGHHHEGDSKENDSLLSDVSETNDSKLDQDTLTATVQTGLNSRH
jgi:hypothetical protein